MYQHDDTQVGHVLSRREILASLSAAGAAILVPSAGGRLGRAAMIGGAALSPLPGCIVRPAQTEGPYFVDTRLNRSDIRSDPGDGAVPDGAPLHLVFRVSRLGSAACAPLAGALVDLWQCDGLGVYSGVKDDNRYFDTRGKQFLRGHQRTGADGSAAFRTIYPGWYEGRTVHIHFKIRTDPDARRGREFTSQLYFDDSISDQVFVGAPYRANRQRRVRNDRDGIFRRGGRELTLAVEPERDGYRAAFEVGLAIG